MSDSDMSKKEVTRLRHLLLKMAELAEHVEQTGSFESGLNNSLTRYNTIVQRLEQIGACPKSLFPSLDSDASAGTLGAEATLLAEYLEDIAQEEEPSPKSMPDLHTIVSLAPFLGREELGDMVRERFRSRDRRGRREGRCEEDSEVEADSGRSRPDLKTLVHLAPHMNSSDLGDLVRAYVSRGDGVDLKYIVHLAPHMKSEDLGLLVRACVSGERGFDSKYLMHLAPHMNSKDLSAIMRDCMPDWFSSESSGNQSQGQPTPPVPPVPPVAPVSPVTPVAPVAPVAPVSPVAPVVYAAPAPPTQVAHVAPLSGHEEEIEPEFTHVETEE